jgi:hypothetical protein
VPRSLIIKAVPADIGGEEDLDAPSRERQSSTGRKSEEISLREFRTGDPYLGRRGFGALAHSRNNGRVIRFTVVVPKWSEAELVSPQHARVVQRAELAAQFQSEHSEDA